MLSGTAEKLSSLTAIPSRIHRISSDLRSSAAQGPDSTRVGDRLGSPQGAVSFLPLFNVQVSFVLSRCHEIIAMSNYLAKDSCLKKKLGTLLDLCVSSLRRGHANLLCIVPILTDVPRRESIKLGPNLHCIDKGLLTTLNQRAGSFMFL